MNKLISLAYLASVLFLSSNSCSASDYFNQDCCLKSEEGRSCPLQRSSDDKKNKSFVCCDEARVGTLPTLPRIDQGSITPVALIQPAVTASQTIVWELVSIVSDPDPPNDSTFLSPPTRAPPFLTA